jgi:hypothetical protein
MAYEPFLLSYFIYIHAVSLFCSVPWEVHRNLICFVPLWNISACTSVRFLFQANGCLSKESYRITKTRYKVEPGGEWNEGLRCRDLVRNVANFWCAPLHPPNSFVQVVYVVRFSVTGCRYIEYERLLPKPRQNREILWLAALCADDNCSHSVPEQLRHWHRLRNWYENIICLLHWYELILQGNLINLFLIRLLASPFGRDCTVCVATTYSAWRSRIHGSILANSKWFFHSQTSVPFLRPIQPSIKFVSRYSVAG